MVRDPLQLETIVAIATAAGSGAIGIIRLSGSRAIPIASTLWVNGGLSVDKFASNQLYYGKITDFSTGHVVDRVLAVLFRAPNSFTGEDLVELHTHGNPLLLAQVIELCQRAGARMAEPGEFSRRAFLNGKLDLSQAEAIADVIAATSAESLRCAQEQLHGDLSQQIRSELRALTELRAFVEATIDFPDDEVGLLAGEQIQEKIAAMRERLGELSRSYHTGRLYKEGARVVLVGPPNAGKSSLLNAIVGEQRALVHHSAGTTRDVVEADVVWEGVPIRLLDTAGLHEVPPSPAHEVEALGIERTRQWMQMANVRIVVVDGMLPLSMDQREALTALPREHSILWRNKSDLGSSTEDAMLSELFPEAPIISGSAKTSAGLDDLRSAVLRILRGDVRREHEGVMLTTRRHKEGVDEAMKALQNSAVALENRPAPELIAEDLRSASVALGRIVGEVTSEDLLGEIFSRFCIGK